MERSVASDDTRPEDAEKDGSNDENDTAVKEAFNTVQS
jgi:hypothetical protein